MRMCKSTPAANPTQSRKGSISMKKLEQIYEGKAKKVFRTDDPEQFIVEYKDDATAFNGLKKGTILGKGAINNRMTNLLMQMLEKKGVHTHFVEELSERETLVKRVRIVPLEEIYRQRGFGARSPSTKRRYQGTFRPA